MYLRLLLFLPFGWIFYALMAKRWHDRERSKIWTLLILPPIAGPIWTFIELGFLRGTEGPNRFGSDPTGDIRAVNINQLKNNQPLLGKVIELDGTDTTDGDLVRLAENSEIEELRLGGTQITDDGMKFIGQLLNSTTLDISMTAITDLGLGSLLNLTNLTELWLGGTRITDAGLMKLSILSRLENLYVVNTGISRAGVDCLKKILPRCKVHC